MAVDIHPKVIHVHDLVISSAAPSEITRLKGVIRHIIWQGGTTGGHVAQLRDTIGNLLWRGIIQMVTEGSTLVPAMNLNLGFNGLQCDDLDSGELLIYYDKLHE